MKLFRYLKEIFLDFICIVTGIIELSLILILVSCGTVGIAILLGYLTNFIFCLGLTRDDIVALGMSIVMCSAFVYLIVSFVYSIIKYFIKKWKEIE